MPASYRPPELADDDEDEAPPSFGHTLDWNYHADFLIGFQEGPNRGQRVELLLAHLEEGQSITLGAAGARINDIELDDPDVDNVQAMLHFASGRFTLVNESDAESLSINGFPIHPEQPALLKSGDRIACGSTVMVFLARSVLEVLSQVELLRLDEASGQLLERLDLLKEVVVIGRSSTCDLVFDDTEIARKHAAITLREGAFYLVHLSNTGSTFLNGISLPKGRERLLTLGDRLRLSARVMLELTQRDDV
jgi:predicted component of type VI protein secretion system